MQSVIDHGRSVALAVDADVAGEVRDRGYVTVAGGAFRTAAWAPELDRLRAAYDHLEPDAYLADGGAYRLRRHVRYRYRAARQTLLPSVPGAYLQSAEVNPFAGGVARYFAPVSPEVRDNPFLHALLLRSVREFAQGLEPCDWEVDVHLVRVRAQADEEGLPSPEGVHRDGFEFISLHLMGRAGVLGGRSIICAADGAPLERPLLAEPMDSLYADDRRILHGTEPVRLDPAAGLAEGHRDMLLTSYRRAV
ncbi:2OG-Fe dioxygenase family protein [Streptomyces sp. NPDC033538]|uniref:2OG-Fe dioxygenase family protein n=1 Tax=Streptomyces sp. NPDC033538 TaxID=3155367 RepID=UPI0033F6ACF0